MRANPVAGIATSAERKMTMKIYIITMGEYSDKYNYGVTFDKEKAERFVKRFNAANRWQDAQVEEHELDGWEDERLTFYVVLKKDKITAETTDFEDDLYELKPYTEFFRTGQGLFDYVEKQTGYYIYVKAKDTEHAVKIACDLLAEFKAREAGIG